MGHATINGKPIKPQSSPQIISRSAILILSGVLIGTTIAQGDLAGFAIYRCCAGVIGLIAFLALDLAAQGHRKRVVRKTLAAVDSTLMTRLRRHLTPQSPKGPQRRRAISLAESSYLPVTLAARG